MKKTIFVLFFLFAILFLCSCKSDSDELLQIQVKDFSENTIITDELDLENYELILYFSDGTKEYIKLNDNMIDINDIYKLTEEGNHQLKIKYESLETTISYSIIKSNYCYRFDYYLADLNGNYIYNSSDEFKSAYKYEFSFGDNKISCFEGFTLEEHYEYTIENNVSVYKLFYSRNTYNVYIYIDNKIVHTESYLYEEEININFIPQKDNYVFIGYDLEHPTNIGYSDIYLIAQFEPIIITYTFLDGNNQIIDTKSGIKGSKIILPENPESYRDEMYTYTFSKWDGYQTDMVLSENITFKAIYTISINEYTVTFKNIDETILNIQKVKYGDNAVYGGTTPIKPVVAGKDFVFIGWNQSLINITSDLIVYPLYEDITNKVMVNVVVDNETTVQYVEIGGSVVLPESPTKEGHTFIEWDKSNENITESITITAIFEINYYDISYIIDGELYGEVHTLKYGTTLEEQIPPVKEGYIFIGWSEDIQNVPANDCVIYGHYIDISELLLAYDGSERKITVNDSYIEYEISYQFNGNDVSVVKNAGSYNLTFKYKEMNNLEYIFEYQFVIQKGQSIITASDINTVYNGKYHSISYELNHNEAIIETTTNSFINAGSYEVILSVAECDNYYGSTITKNINISKNTFDISNITFEDQKYIYDGNKKVLKISGELPDGLTVVYTTNELIDVGTIDVTVTFVGDFDNYNYVSPMYATLMVEKRNASIIIDNQESFYGETLKEFTYNLVNVTNDIKINIIKEEGLDVGTYVLTTDYQNDNYNLTIINGLYTIKRATYKIDNISFDSSTYIYDGSEKTVLINGELPSGLSVSYQNNKLINVGKVTATAIFEGDFENYYPIDNLECELEILAKDAYIIIDNKISVYGETLVLLTATNIGFAETDNIEYQLLKEDGLEVGTYVITTTYTNNNYNLTIIDGEYTIVENIFAGLLFENQIIEYDGNNHSLEVEGLTEGLSVSYSNNSFKNAGSYEVEATIEDEFGNSIVLKAILTITKKDAVINIDDKSSVYGEEIVKLTYTTEGFYEEIIVNVYKEEGLKVGVYTLTTDYSNTNYNITVNNGKYVIKKAEAVITMDSIQNLFIYNGEEHHLTASLNHDECELTYINNNRVATGYYELIVSSSETENYLACTYSFNYAIKYQVNFFDNYGNNIYTTYAVLDESVDFPYDYPSGDSSDFYYYEFSNWSYNIDCIKENVDVYPEYIRIPINYIVTFIDGNGNIIKEYKDLSYGDYVEEPFRTVKYSDDINKAYVFTMWNPVDYDNSIKTSPTERTVIVEGIFEQVPAVAKINEKYYGSISDALYAAKANEVVIVIKNAGANYIINEDTIINEGVTLYIPYDNDISLEKANGDLANSSFDIEKLYISVIIKESTLTVYGDLVIGAVTGNTLYNDGNFLQGVINGAYSKIVMEDSANIVVGNEEKIGNVVCYGIIEDNSITNKASITVNSNSILSENFVIYDWRNENYLLSNFKNRSLVSPFNRYQLPYIDVLIRFNNGSIYQGNGKVYSDIISKFFGMPFTIVGYAADGSVGMFTTANDDSYITKKFFDPNNKVAVDSYTDNLDLTLYGKININSFNIVYEGAKYSTNQIYFPIPYGMSIYLNNCDLMINTKYKILPGAKFVIDENSSLTIKTLNVTSSDVEPSVVAGIIVYDSYYYDDAIVDIYPFASQLTIIGKSSSGSLINNGVITIDSLHTYIGGRLTGTGIIYKNYVSRNALKGEIPNIEGTEYSKKSYLELFWNGKRIASSKTGTFD